MNKGLMYAIITAVLFTTLEPVSKLIAAEISPEAITMWRFLFSSLALLPLALYKIKKEQIKITLKDLGIMTLMGTVFVCLIMYALQSGVKYADSPAVISMIFSTNSVFTILFSLLILKDPLTKNKIIALVFCSLGIVVCSDISSGTNLFSAGLGILAAVTFSLYTVISKKYMSKVGGVVQVGITFSAGSIVMLLGMLLLGTDVAFPVRLDTMSVMIYLGVAVTGIGYWSYFRGIEKGGAIIGSLAFFIKPILTPFATWIVNGIVPDWSVVVAVVLIVAGSYFALYKKETAKCAQEVL